MRAIPRARLTGGVLLSAVAFGLAATALGTAGSANASCASLNGQSIGHGCTSDTGGASVALGRGARADSSGPGSVAVAVGNPGPNGFYPGAILPTHAVANGPGSTSVALGDGSQAGSLGNGSHAFVVGRGSNAFSYGGNKGNIPFAGKGDTSVTVGNGSEAGAVGNHKLSTAFGNGHQRQNNGLGG